MKINTKSIFFLLIILLVVSIFSLYMKYEKGPKDSFIIDLDQDTFEKMTNDIFTIPEKYDDSKGNYVIPKPVIDTIIDNIRSISKGSTENLKTIPNK